MNLFDTNIYLEVILDQEKSDLCIELLNRRSDTHCISDLSLHSIGILLFRKGNEQTFMGSTWLIHLPVEGYNGVIDTRKRYGLDFDDAYQLTIARIFGLTIITMDKHFTRVSDVNVELL